MQMVLNELSLCAPELDKNEADQIFEKFIDTYNEAVKAPNNFDRSLLTSVDLNSLELSKGYYVAQWRNQVRDRDLCRRFMGMCDRQEILESDRDESEIECEKGIGNGLLAAYENNSICISLLFDPYWSLFEIPCKYYSLKADTICDATVCNLSDAIQLQEHASTIAKMRQCELAKYDTPQLLLAHLHEVFPHLIFHKVALNQLKDEVQQCHLSTICKKLLSLENYLTQWDGSKFGIEAFPERSVSIESRETLKRFKKEYTFEFGEKQVIVSHHMRYTGNIPGRIYFHPDHEQKKAYICSLTTKLPTVSETSKRI